MICCLVFNGAVICLCSGAVPNPCKEQAPAAGCYEQRRVRLTCGHDQGRAGMHPSSCQTIVRHTNSVYAMCEAVVHVQP